jgi:hypothetical protein
MSNFCSLGIKFSRLFYCLKSVRLLHEIAASQAPRNDMRCMMKKFVKYSSFYGAGEPSPCTTAAWQSHFFSLADIFSKV